MLIASTATGEGAGVAADWATKTYHVANTTHKVLSAVEMAGGVSVLVKTGATPLVKEGIKAACRRAAIEVMQEVASATAANLANYAAELAGVPEEQREWIAVGVDAYQAFSFLKAARVDMGGNCFVAGTGVVTGLDDRGIALTRHIEDIKVGDVVLARDQHDAADDTDLRRVTNVFRKTSDHLRILTIAGDDGNVETLRTTNEHPFYVADRGWVGAGDLQKGDLAQETDGSWQTVLTSIRQDFAAGITVYNIEVEGDHTYFVDDGVGDVDAVWVHNICVGDRFAARMGTKGVYFNNIPVTNQRFRKVGDTSALQQAAGPEKNRFVQDLGRRAQTDSELARQLSDAGVSPADFTSMAATGKRPKGFKCIIRIRSNGEGITVKRISSC